MPLLSVAPANAAAENTNTRSVEVTIYEDGTIVPADEPQPLGDSETELSNGLLEIQATNCTYVRISYNKYSGSPVDVKFGFYNSGNNPERGWINNVGAGQTVSEVWNQINTSGSVTGYMTARGQQQFNLPPVSCA
ncbi:hypothetical protein FHX37_0077 [Haloactinospora alba]|uniref:Uncharacterized protein n=2 Tax=Haloactinospora alba TaxID=405555 RepID=A0A543NEG7_9ACTN|nr:hypothetical protein FHX37_0077 [Haloactinospora alba]